MALRKGNTYIVKGTDVNYWYIVRQIGQKSWVATPFTHTHVIEGKGFFKGNGLNILEIMSKEIGAINICRSFTVNSKLREAMFNILQYGRLES